MDQKLGEVVDSLVIMRYNIFKLIGNYEKKISELKEEVNSDDSHENGINIVKDLTIKTNLSNKVCWYFNRGYCKRRKYCKHKHETRECMNYLKGQSCEATSCSLRHKSECKYWKLGFCFRWNGCAYLHKKIFRVSKSEWDEIKIAKEVGKEMDTDKAQVRNTTDDTTSFEHKKVKEENYYLKKQLT